MYLLPISVTITFTVYTAGIPLLPSTPTSPLLPGSGVDWISPQPGLCFFHSIPCKCCPRLFMTGAPVWGPGLLPGMASAPTGSVVDGATTDIYSPRLHVQCDELLGTLPPRNPSQRSTPAPPSWSSSSLGFTAMIWWLLMVSLLQCEGLLPRCTSSQKPLLQ